MNHLRGTSNADSITVFLFQFAAAADAAAVKIKAAWKTSTQQSRPATRAWKGPGGKPAAGKPASRKPGPRRQELA